MTEPLSPSGSTHRHRWLRAVPASLDEPAFWRCRCGERYDGDLVEIVLRQDDAQFVGEALEGYATVVGLAKSPEADRARPLISYFEGSEPTAHQTQTDAAGQGRILPTALGPIKLIPECAAQAVCVNGLNCWEAGCCLKSNGGRS